MDKQKQNLTSKTSHNKTDNNLSKEIIWLLPVTKRKKKKKKNEHFYKKIVSYDKITTLLKTHQNSESKIQKQLGIEM